MFHVEQFAVSAYSGSTPAESRTQEAKWIFHREKPPSYAARNGYMYCGTAL